MRRSGFALAIALVWVISGCGKPDSTPAPQTTTTDPPAPARAKTPAATDMASGHRDDGESAEANETAPTGPLLWKISRGDKSGYLFGTVHLGVAPDALAPAVWTAFDACATLVVESDIASGRPDELLALATTDGGDSLRSQLSATQWKQARAMLPDVPGETLERFEPWYVSVLVSARMLPPGEPMEASFVRRARRANKGVSHLESWRDQIAALEKATGVTDLQALLDAPDKARTDLQRMLELYAAGDEVALRELVDALARESGNLDSVAILVDARNQAWLDALGGHFDKGGAFAAVGAAHLAGDRGLLTLLETRGFAVERVAP